MSKTLLAGYMALAVLFGTGCTNPPKRTALHDFGLAAPQQPALVKSAINVTAPTWLWDNRIRYRLLYAAPTQVRFYGLDLWIASPPELFEQYLRHSGNTAAYSWDIQLLDFEQQFDSPNQARVLLRFSVDAYSKDRQQKLGSQLFSLTMPTETPDAAGAIVGFTALVSQAAVKIQHWAEELEDAHRINGTAPKIWGYCGAQWAMLIVLTSD